MSKKMKAVVLTAAKKLEWIEKEIPQPEKGELLIRMKHVGVCGSDIHFYQDGRLGNWIPDGPLILGHEPGGIVEAVGEGVSGFAPGDKVAIEPGVPCGSCEYCRRGLYNLCEHMSFMAIPREREGVFAEYCVHSASMCYRLPEEMDTLEGAMLEPLAVGFHAVSQSSAKMGQSALILGSGCIGLVTMLVLLANGVKDITVADVMDTRLQKAKELGARHIINSMEEDLGSATATIHSEGFDLVFETAGNSVTTLMAGKLVKKAGTVTLVGMAPKAELNFDIGTLMANEAEVKTVFRYRNYYPAAIEAVKTGSISIKSVVSHVFPFSDTIAAVEQCATNKRDIIKAVIEF